MLTWKVLYWLGFIFTKKLSFRGYWSVLTLKHQSQPLSLSGVALSDFSFKLKSSSTGPPRGKDMDTPLLSCEDLHWCFALRVLLLRPDAREKEKGSGREALQKEDNSSGYMDWIQISRPRCFYQEAGSECVWLVPRAMLTQLMSL